MISVDSRYDDSWKRDIDAAKRAALKNAAEFYAGRAPGTSPGVRASSPVDFRNRFTRTNTHGFAALSPRYEKAKRRRFGTKPILVASGNMVLQLRDAATVIASGMGDMARAVVIFRLGPVAEGHFRGARHLPKRDPVSPNEADRMAFRAKAADIFRQLLQRSRAARR